jgi:hypothetical protein
LIHRRMFSMDEVCIYSRLAVMPSIAILTT